MKEKKVREDESEEEIDPEDEAPLDSVGQTLIVVPTDLLPAIRELIAKHKGAGQGGGGEEEGDA
jgi:hypothetical protein